jgi:hypothetical protein
MQFAVAIAQTEHPVYKQIDSMNKSCLMSCGENPHLKRLIQGRGENYYISEVDDHTTETLQNCFLSFYNATHFFMYLLLGYFCPSLFMETFLLGVAFEIYEYQYLDCADPLDVFYNCAGFAVGRYLSP